VSFAKAINYLSLAPLFIQWPVTADRLKMPFPYGARRTADDSNTKQGENHMAKSMIHILALRDLLGAGHPKVVAELAAYRQSIDLDTGSVTVVKTADYFNAPVLNLKPGNDARRICRRRDSTVLRGSVALKHLEDRLKKRK
jgi:hypothetical protein